MKLSAPKKAVFVVSLVLAVIALLMATPILPVMILGIKAAWVAIAAYILLMLGNVLKGF